MFTTIFLRILNLLLPPRNPCSKHNIVCGHSAISIAIYFEEINGSFDHEALHIRSPNTHTRLAQPTLYNMQVKHRIFTKSCSVPCVCERERESLCVYMCVSECVVCVCVRDCVCVCACVWRECVCECVRVSVRVCLRCPLALELGQG